ncbi:MAG TPA: type IV pilin protein, partial [Albitalea sp.]
MASNHRRAGARGFSLPEVLCALAVLGLLLGVAWPGLRHAVQQARRLDAVAALLQLQVAQEGHRAQHRRYGTLEELHLPGRSPAGHYRIAIASADAAGFEAQAVADGVQARDAACRRYALRVAGTHVVQSSGRDGGPDNDD